MNNQAKVWEEEVRIPTYGIGKPEPHPMFLEKRVYQGSSGVVYPYPVIEKIEDTCEEKTYHAVFLENEYLKIMILPEIGGRVQMAYDKLKQRHFIYYNHVIKPALVGLAGPWISGGIEFNWPQHHRPSTFLPVDFSTETMDDGSVAVWVSERERMFHQRCVTGFVLHPSNAYLEIQCRLSNPTSLPQTFLWWANPAVKVNDEYQSVFPADVNAVFDHGKRDVSSYPIATGTYYKVDYSSGVDISRYKNIPVPTSYMAIESKYDFMGGYENDTRAGVLHVANHHVSPGKKQWTWGCGDFGKMWDRNLTDEDGPYIELMTGVFTDNQPDFSWLQPGEEKTFRQYFMPYRELGVVKNATADLLMNIDLEGGGAVLKLFATSCQKNLRIVVEQNGKALLDCQHNISPENVLTLPVNTKSLENISVKISNSDGKEVLGWKAGKNDSRPMPEPAKAALEPSEVSSTEQLYLTGFHLEQYRHATYQPTDYYLEALRRDSTDIRCNNAMGLWLIRHGQFERAEPYLRTAIKTQTERNPNPYDGEPYYNLGLSLKYQGKTDEAYDAFYKACWNSAWQDAGYLALAQISAARGDYDVALDETERSLLRNWHGLCARHLKACMLRRLGRSEEALAFIETSLQYDAFSFGCLFEKYLISQAEEDRQVLAQRMRGEGHNYEEVALDYARAGLWPEVVQVVDFALDVTTSEKTMLHYYKVWALCKQGLPSEARAALAFAEQQSPACVFPNALEAIEALQTAISLNENVVNARYYLGNLWYDKRQYAEAVAQWEEAAQRGSQVPTVYRNLALAYYNKFHRTDEAVAMLERAFSMNEDDARILMELDQLYKCVGRQTAERKALLEAHSDVVMKRDDLYLEYVTLLNQTGHYAEAVELLAKRHFHPWEGGEGKVAAQYQLAHLELAKQLLEAQRFDEALNNVEACYVYPLNLGEGKLQGAAENDFDYYRGLILERLNRNEEAREAWAKASVGLSEPVAAIFYNDQKPDKIFYQGLALLKLWRNEEALQRFDRLIAYGEAHRDDKFKIDYFAVSLPDLQIWEKDMERVNRVHCLYLIGLGYLGKKQFGEARKYLDEAYALDPNHQGVAVHLQMVEKEIAK